MNIFKRKKPIVVEMPVIPPRPVALSNSFLSGDELFVAKEPVINHGKVFYPVGRDGGVTVDYYETRDYAQAVCDHWNITVKKRDKKLRAKRAKEVNARNKEIADWDAKYKNKAIRVEIK